jgi:hypothetical protein
VDVVTTGCFAVDGVFVAVLELHKANRTIVLTVDWLAVVVGFLCVNRHDRRGISKDLAQLA